LVKRRIEQRGGKKSGLIDKSRRREGGREKERSEKKKKGKRKKVDGGGGIKEKRIRSFEITISINLFKRCGQGCLFCVLTGWLVLILNCFLYWRFMRQLSKNRFWVAAYAAACFPAPAYAGDRGFSVA
jgi:hypothetical protein